MHILVHNIILCKHSKVEEGLASQIGPTRKMDGAHQVQPSTRRDDSYSESSLEGTASLLMIHSRTSIMI